MVQVGDIIKNTSDNENYNKWRNKTWEVSHIARSRAEHPGYDEGIGGALIDAKGLPVSLYEYEYEILSSLKKRKGKGWKESPDASGKAPRHKAVATKKKLRSTARVPMGKQELSEEIFNEYPRLRAFVFDYFVREWEGGDDDTNEIMRAMGWEPFPIDHKKYNNYMQATYEDRADEVTRQIINKERPATGTPLNDLTYQLISEEFGSLLQDITSNWVAEGFNKSRI